MRPKLLNICFGYVTPALTVYYVASCAVSATDFIVYFVVVTLVIRQIGEERSCA